MLASAENALRCNLLTGHVKHEHGVLCCTMCCGAQRDGRMLKACAAASCLVLHLEQACAGGVWEQLRVLCPCLGQQAKQALVQLHAEALQAQLAPLRPAVHRFCPLACTSSSVRLRSA